MKHSYAKYVPAIKTMSDEIRLKEFLTGITSEKEDCICKNSNKIKTDNPCFKGCD